MSSHRWIIDHLSWRVPGMGMAQVIDTLHIPTRWANTVCWVQSSWSSWLLEDWQWKSRFTKILITWDYWWRVINEYSESLIDYSYDMPESSPSDSQPRSTPLKYTIASSSPHSAKYAPENIIADKPMDQASRWSGAFQASTDQWITLELESLSVLSMWLYFRCGNYQH